MTPINQYSTKKHWLKWEATHSRDRYGRDDAFTAGYRAAVEDCAKVAEQHATTHGPVVATGMGGWAIAKKIRARAGETNA